MQNGNSPHIQSARAVAPEDGSGGLGTKWNKDLERRRQYGSLQPVP